MELNKIEYRPRYSDTMDNDHMGRWARIAYSNKIQIAWISKVVLRDNKEGFNVRLQFPTKHNDCPHEHGLFDSYEKAQDFVYSRWNWFVGLINGDIDKSKLDCLHWGDGKDCPMGYCECKQKTK